MIGDHARGPAHHQPAGGAEKTADDRVGNEADGAAGAGDAKPKEQESGERRRKPHDDHHRREKIVGNTLGAQPTEQGYDQRRRDCDGCAVRSGDGEGQGAPRRDESGADGRGQEGRGDAIGDPWRQRRGEDQRGEGQAIGDRDGAGNESGKNVSGESRKLSSYRASVGSGCIIDGHASEPFNVSTLIVFTLLWRDSAADA